MQNRRNNPKNAIIFGPRPIDAKPSRKRVAHGWPDEEIPLVEPERRFHCENYNTCLDLAAILDWETFCCTNCCGCIDQQLLWRAHNRLKHEKGLAILYSLPDLSGEGFEG